MNRATRKRGWVAFGLTSMILLGMVVFLLGICRIQLHDQVIESEFHSLKTSFDKILKDQMLGSFPDDLTLSTNQEFSAPFFLDTSKVIERAAMQSLNIPQVFGVQAYDSLGNPEDLATSLDSCPMGKDMIAKILRQGWGERIIDERTWALALGPDDLDNEYFVEFQLMLEPLQESWNRIDHTLIKQGILICIGALLVLAVVYRNLISKLAKQEKLLEEKSFILAETNRKLSQACKAAGLGAMTGHLMHGLKTPLTSLQSIATDLAKKESKQGEPQIIQTIKDIRKLVNRVLESLRELEDGKNSYAISLSEFSELAKERFSADHSDSNLSVELEDETYMDNLQCHLSLAILSNLFQNSVEASKSARIKLRIAKDGETLNMLVCDDAGGIPASLSGRLFSPLTSTKPGGTGIGLALSKQLAESMDAKLELVSNDRTGSCFCLNLKIQSFSDHSVE